MGLEPLGQNSFSRLSTIRCCQGRVGGSPTIGEALHDSGLQGTASWRGRGTSWPNARPSWRPLLRPDTASCFQQLPSTFPLCLQRTGSPSRSIHHDYGHYHFLLGELT